MNKILDLQNKSTERFTKNLSQWRNYKSSIENTFKDWIPIFFNAVIRIAKSANFSKVRIVLPEVLMTKWQSYVTPQTVTLLNRIYKQQSQFYNAKVVSLRRYPYGDWYELDLGNQELKIASTTWLYRI